MAVFPSLEEVQWPIEVVNEDITGGEETFQETVGWIGVFTAKFLSSGKYPPFFAVRKLLVSGTVIVHLYNSYECLKRPVKLNRSSIEVKQKPVLLIFQTMVGKTHSHITGDLIGLGELYP